MSRFKFQHCAKCGRLNIHGQRCVCVQVTPLPCDCTFDGNRQNIGPRCHQRIADVWRDAIGQGREIARHLKESR